MKLTLVLLSAVVLVASETPSNRAPYPPAGYRPTGQQFSLPQREFGQFRAEKQQELPAVYGPPTEEPEITTTEYPTTTEGAEAEQIQEERESEKESGELVEEGVYYIYHPNGLLQRVMYAARNDAERMKYTAELNYKDVEPIKDPIFTYDPNTLALQQINGK